MFSCGTSGEGYTILVEWNDFVGAIKRVYSGFIDHPIGVVQFDTTRNRFLAAGDDFQIKFWDMDKSDMIMATDADDELSARPRLKFNKEGSLLAVSTNNNGIKVLANGDGQRMLQMLEAQTSSDTVKATAKSIEAVDSKVRTLDGADKTKKLEGP